MLMFVLAATKVEGPHAHKNERKFKLVLNLNAILKHEM
ncbi:Uncharacterised protein [uncultured archaeon]|nr:Uncharacterised protein [uncultured archaeon]